jgi:hypothetical protein
MPGLRVPFGGHDGGKITPPMTKNVSPLVANTGNTVAPFCVAVCKRKIPERFGPRAGSDHTGSYPAALK